MKYKHFETISRKEVKTAQFNGYYLNKNFEDMMFQITIQEDGTLKASVLKKDEDYFSDFNTEKWLAEAEKYAVKADLQDSISGEDCILINDISSFKTEEMEIKAIPITATTYPSAPSQKGMSDIMYILEEKEEIKPIVLGKYKTKKQFGEFIGTKGNINLLSKTAFIEGRYITGIGLEDTSFKMTICDENTIDFEEVGTNNCTDDEIKRYIAIIEDSAVSQFRDRSVASDFLFKINTTLKGKEVIIEAYVVIEFEKPYDKLLSFLEEETPKEYDEDDIASKMKLLFPEEFKEESEMVVKPVAKPVEIIEELDSRSMIANEFLEAKKVKREKIYKQIDTVKNELKIARSNSRLANSKISECEKDIDLLISRIDSMNINEPFNGYYFFIPEAVSEKCTLDENTTALMIKKLISIRYQNIEGFFNLFSNTSFRIRIAEIKDNNLIEVTNFKEVVPILSKLTYDEKGKISLIDGNIIYEGDIEWSSLNNKMVRLGFQNSVAFNEMCKDVPAQEENEDENSNLENGSIDDADLCEEQIAEFEEENGYPMGDEFLFAIGFNADATDDMCDAQVCISITPKSYFVSQGYAYDQHLEYVLKSKFPVLKAMGDKFEELSESAFQMNDDIKPLGLLPTIETLCRAGIMPSFSFQDLCDSACSKKVFDAVKKLGYIDKIQN